MINKEYITKTLKDNKINLSKKYHLTFIGIFGSVTRDDFRDDSDIDILIDYDQPIGIEFIDLAHFPDHQFRVTLILFFCLAL